MYSLKSKLLISFSAPVGVLVLALLLVPGAGIGASGSFDNTPFDHTRDRRDGLGSEGAVAPIYGVRLDVESDNVEPANVQLRTATYTYDDAGRLVSVDYGAGKTIYYIYDNAGNLLRRCTLTADYRPDANVDIAEIMEIARRFGAGTGAPLYDAAYDLIRDGTIDAADTQQAANQWRLCQPGD